MATIKGATRHELIVPSNTVNLKTPMRLWANSTGNIAVVDQFDVVNVYAVTPGQIIPVLAKRVNSTNTTASSIIGVFDDNA